MIKGLCYELGTFGDFFALGRSGRHDDMDMRPAFSNKSTECDAIKLARHVYIRKNNFYVFVLFQDLNGAMGIVGFQNA